MDIAYRLKVEAAVARWYRWAARREVVEALIAESRAA